MMNKQILSKPNDHVVTNNEVGGVAGCIIADPQQMQNKAFPDHKKPKVMQNSQSQSLNPGQPNILLGQNN